jgi:hypothetical protein
VRETFLAVSNVRRKLSRLGHSADGVTETYTFTRDEREAAEKLGELFDVGWPEKGEVEESVRQAARS